MDRNMKAYMIGYTTAQDKSIILELIKKRFTKNIINLIQDELTVETVLVKGVPLTGYKTPRFNAKMKVKDWEKAKSNAKRLAKNTFGTSGVNAINNPNFNTMEPHHILSLIFVTIGNYIKLPQRYFTKETQEGYSFRMGVYRSLLQNKIKVLKQLKMNMIS